MILFIDSTDFNQVTYALKDHKKGLFLIEKYSVNPHESHETLQHLDEFLRSAKLTSTSPALRFRSGHPPHVLGREIKKIYVNKGPGSYTGTRIGVTHALALGFAWNVPVKPLEKEKFEQELKKSAK